MPSLVPQLVTDYFDNSISTARQQNEIVRLELGVLASLLAENVETLALAKAPKSQVRCAFGNVS